MKVFTFLCSAALSVATFAEAPFIARESVTFSQNPRHGRQLVIV